VVCWFGLTPELQQSGVKLQGFFLRAKLEKWAVLVPTRKPGAQGETNQRSLGLSQRGVRVLSLQVPRILALCEPGREANQSMGALARPAGAGVSERSFAMKMSFQMVERALSQFEAEAVPENHPAVTQLNRLFVVKLASWSDSSHTTLAPHPPEATDLVILLEAA
jgi:hypothetical protein